MSAGWELIDHNPGTGLRKWMGYDEETDSVLISYGQDRAAVNAILDRNKAGQAEQHGRMGDMELAAEIPTIVMYEWLTKYGVDFWNPAHKPGVIRLLNDPDYRYLKCRNIIF
jgi:hypothetical protein